MALSTSTALAAGNAPPPDTPGAGSLPPPLLVRCHLRSGAALATLSTITAPTVPTPRPALAGFMLFTAHHPAHFPRM